MQCLCPFWHFRIWPNTNCDFNNVEIPRLWPRLRHLPILIFASNGWYYCSRKCSPDPEHMISSAFLLVGKCNSLCLFCHFSDDLCFSASIGWVWKFFVGMHGVTYLLVMHFVVFLPFYISMLCVFMCVIVFVRDV